MKILFFTDVDGTLINDHFVGEDIIEKARLFTSQGHFFSLATGRPALSIQWLADVLPVNFPCILLTGSIAYDLADKTYRGAVPLTPRILDRIEIMLREYPSFSLQAFTQDEMYNLRINPFMESCGIPEEIARPVVSSRNLEGKQVLKIGFSNENVSLLQSCCRRLFDDPSLYCHHFASEHFVEVYSPDAGKGNAIESLLKNSAVQPDLVAVAGDSDTDLSMFSKADISFASQTAAPSVVAAADYIIPPPERGGISKALDILLKLANPSKTLALPIEKCFQKHGNP